MKSELLAADSVDEQMNATLTSLWQNWAFRLSLSSNELFHSNILQYIAEMLTQATDPVSVEGAQFQNEDSSLGGAVEPQRISAAAARQLLRILCGAKPAPEQLMTRLTDDAFLTVRREWFNLDLVVLLHPVKAGAVKVGQPLFALEIKAKSYPTRMQLEEYVKLLQTKGDGGGFSPPLFLLTGMGKEVAYGLPGLLAVLDFCDLSKRLQGLVLSASAMQVLDEYVRMCTLFGHFFACCERYLCGSLSMADAHRIAARLEPFRLHAVWWKLWASHIVQLCDERLLAAGVDRRDLVSTSAYTRVGVVDLYLVF